jgi:outer membrane protein OmpA-like peptidoglycan-associated protein
VKTADDGSILVCLPTSNLYGIQINTPGYLFVSEAINLPDSGDIDKPYISTYLMNKIALGKGRPIVLKNIYFESGSASLSAISDVELNILSQMMKSNPSIIVQINGHTDDVGSVQSNILLSQQRADAVVKRLIQLGVPVKSLIAKGYGESRPVSANNSEAGRQNNRRIEFEVK